MDSKKLSELFEPLNKSQTNKAKNEDGEAWLIDRETLSHHSLITSSDPVKCDINKKATQLKKGDVIFTLSGSKENDMARAAVVDCDLDNLYFGDFLAAFRPKEEFDNDYLVMVLNELSQIRFSFSRYSQRGTGISNIKKSDILKVSIPVTDIDAQHKIGSLFHEINSEIAQREALGKKLKDQKKWQMDNSFVG